MNRLFLATFALCALLLGIAACGGDDDSEGSGTGVETTATVDSGSDETADAADPTEDVEDTDAPVGDVDACALVTPEEAADAIGGPVGEPDRSMLAENFYQCVYRIEGGTDLDSTVGVQYSPGASHDYFLELVDDGCPDALGEPNPVAGLGDEAYECIFLAVFTGESLFSLTVIGEGDSEAKQEELAAKIVERVP